MGASTHNPYKSRKHDKPLSPVSPIESNGENWKYPPVAKTRLNGQGTRSEKLLEEVRGKKRLSRPFEQPYPISTPGQKQTPAQAMQSNKKRADPHLSEQPAQAPRRKAVAPPLTIPAPTHHHPRRQPGPNPDQEDQASPERPDRHPNKATRVHRFTRHQGWDPLKQPRQELRNADAPRRDDRRADGQDRDLERQEGPSPWSKPKGWKDTDDHAGRRLLILIVIIAILGGVAVGVYVRMTYGKK